MITDKYLIILQSAPYENYLIESGLEFALALSAFEIPVTIFLTSYANSLLAPQAIQSPEAINREPFYKQLQALELYDIKLITDANKATLNLADFKHIITF